uniref:Transmembrane protein n=1 Tax=Trypanosoma congolense (strain IL3000) TaxID=1068625 RepID=G0UJM9_TRYCI|nr:conserved hypothetical protein [Trypanosoma congolense IL3000]
MLLSLKEHRGRGGIPSNALFIFLTVCHALLGYSVQVVAADVGVQVVNMSLTAVGWAQEAEVLVNYTPHVTSAVCDAMVANPGQVEDGRSCVAFLAPVGPNELSLHMHVETSIVKDFVTVGETFRHWAGDGAGEVLRRITDAVNRAESTSYPVPAGTDGSYFSPCRGEKTKAALPLCSSTQNCKTVVVVEGLEGDVADLLCPNVPEPCGEYIKREELWDGRVEISIEGVKNSLEVAVRFFALLREGSVRARKAGLVQNGRTAQLYALDEMNVYDYPLIDNAKCQANNDWWLLLFAIPFFLLLFLFRYIFGIGRRVGKRIEREAIIDDELRGQCVNLGSGPLQPRELHTVAPHYLAGGAEELTSRYDSNDMYRKQDGQRHGGEVPQPFTPACTEGSDEAVLRPPEVSMGRG